MLPTMFATCRVAFMLVSPVVRMLGAAVTCGNAARSGPRTFSTREAGSDATCRKRFMIVSFTRVGSGQPSE
jgi:hypothetical protein